MKNKGFLSENFPFFLVVKCLIYLNRRVFVMNKDKSSTECHIWNHWLTTKEELQQRNRLGKISKITGALKSVNPPLIVMLLQITNICCPHTVLYFICETLTETPITTKTSTKQRSLMSSWSWNTRKPHTGLCCTSHRHDSHVPMLWNKNNETWNIIWVLCRRLSWKHLHRSNFIHRSLYTLPLGVIGRLCSVIWAHLGHHYYYFG